MTNEELGFLASMVINAVAHWPQISSGTRILIHPKRDGVVIVPSQWPSETHRQEHVEMVAFCGSTMRALAGYGSEMDTLVLTRPEELKPLGGEKRE